MEGLTLTILHWQRTAKRSGISGEIPLKLGASMGKARPQPGSGDLIARLEAEWQSSMSNLRPVEAREGGFSAQGGGVELSSHR